MRLAVVQFRPAHGSVETNVAFIERTIASVDADLIVFPELATSGYFFTSRSEVEAVADAADGPHMRRITEAAERAGRFVVCGFPERDGNKLYNAALITGPGLPPTVYRKTHLFYKETLCFDPGNTGFFVTQLPGLDCTLGTMICYDWRFPESARTLALKGADVIACPSNLVTHIWRMAMPVRALENKVYLAVANRDGTETNGQEDVSFNGQSVIYGFNGDVLTSADAEGEAVLVADITPAHTRMKRFNSINDIFLDRRPELYR